jgi:DNA-binding protein YbaB
MRTDMQAQIGAMLEEYRATRSRIEGLRAAAANMMVTVRSPDRSVTVAVDAAGELRDIRIDPAVAARIDWVALSARILAASRLAAAQAREQMRVKMRDALPERLHDLVGSDGSVDLAAMLPAELSEISRSWAVLP